MVDKGIEIKVIYLDLHKAFVTATHDILVSESERHGFARWTPLLRRNWLDGCSQRLQSQLSAQVEISGECCSPGVRVGAGSV